MVTLHIKDIATKQHLSFDDLQRATNLSVATLTQYWQEEESIEATDADVLRVIAKALNVRASALFSENAGRMSDKFVGEEGIVWL